MYFLRGGENAPSFIISSTSPPNPLSVHGEGELKGVGLQKQKPSPVSLYKRERMYKVEKI